MLNVLKKLRESNKTSGIREVEILVVFNKSDLYKNTSMGSYEEIRKELKREYNLEVNLISARSKMNLREVKFIKKFIIIIIFYYYCIGIFQILQLFMQ